MTRFAYGDNEGKFHASGPKGACRESQQAELKVFSACGSAVREFQILRRSEAEVHGLAFDLQRLAGSGEEIVAFQVVHGSDVGRAR